MRWSTKEKSDFTVEYYTREIKYSVICKYCFQTLLLIVGGGGGACC